jgi:hypothetical protein
MRRESGGPERYVVPYTDKLADEITVSRTNPDDHLCPHEQPNESPNLHANFPATVANGFLE